MGKEGGDRKGESGRRNGKSKSKSKRVKGGGCGYFFDFDFGRLVDLLSLFLA